MPTKPLMILCDYRRWAIEPRGRVYPATVGGGKENVAGGDFATVPGGVRNVASGDVSFAAGLDAFLPLHDRTFVWKWEQVKIFSSTDSRTVSDRVHQAGVGIWYQRA